jgi:hypothetical protein
VTHRKAFLLQPSSSCISLDVSVSNLGSIASNDLDCAELLNGKDDEWKGRSLTEGTILTFAWLALSKATKNSRIKFPVLTVETDTFKVPVGRVTASAILFGYLLQ